MPAVVVTGARQTGKSTLVQGLAPAAGRRYLSLDDLDVLDAARRDPEALVGGEEPVTLDEVQREPDLLHAVKRAIDRRRRPGRFVLTGSANLLLMRRVSESLAGRASYLTLWPMTRREQRGLGRCGAWEKLHAANERDWRAFWPRSLVRPRTGERSRGAADFRFRPSISKRPKSVQSGSTATRAPISNAICRSFLRSPRCPISAV